MSQVSQVAQLEVFVGGLPKVSGKAGDFGCGVGFQEWSMDSMDIASPFILCHSKFVSRRMDDGYIDMKNALRVDI